MDAIQHDTVLLVCSDPIFATRVLTSFFRAGYPIVGPVASASMALMLAAQTAPQLALVARPLTGRRNARDLARDLLRNWGIRSLVLDEAVAGDRPVLDDDARWRTSPRETARLMAALGR